MPIPFACPHCGRQAEVDDQYAGQTGPCVGCGQLVTIPGQAGSPFAALPRAPAPARKSSFPIVLIVLGVVAAVSLPLLAILVGLLLPAVQAAREAARRMQCMNNMKSIMLAMHNHEATYKTFPAFNAPPRSPGVEPFSWRVRLLPFMGENALYERYDYKETWDAPKNRALVEEMPKDYSCPSDRDRTPGKTPYLVVAGRETMFPEDGVSHDEVPDGTSNTIAVVEAHQAKVTWTEPKDLEFSHMTFRPNTGPNDMGSLHGGGVVTVGMADGSVRTIRPNIDPQVLKAMLTRGGGERVTLNRD